MKRTLVASLLAIALSGPAVAQQAVPPRSITPITDNLYRFQDNQGVGVFLVTSEGIVVVDPLNGGAAAWLKDELEERFDVPITHVVYSHHHFDHASGAAVFEGAKIVGRENMAANLAGPPPDAPMPALLQVLDPDGDGNVRLSDTPPFLATLLARGDENGDGVANGREAFLGLHKEVRAPDVTFSAPYDLVVGGKTIRLVPVGGLHASDMTYVLFQEEHVVFVVDVINIKRLPFSNIPDYDQADQEAMFDKALALEWDMIVPGHGEPGTRADLLAFRQYFADLHAGVQAGIDDGQTLEQIQTSLTLDRYKDWGTFEMRPLNIAGMYAYLTRRRP